MGCKKILITALSIILTGCGTSAGVNSERSNIVSISAMPPVIPDYNQVSATQDTLSIEGKIVHGTSCQNKLWDAKPTEKNAVNLMKRMAQEKGYNAIHSVKVSLDPTALVKNCWQAIHAQGIGYTKEPPITPDGNNQNG